MVQEVNTIAEQAWRHELDAQNLYTGGRKDSAPQSCPPASTQALWHEFLPHTTMMAMMTIICPLEKLSRG